MPSVLFWTREAPPVTSSVVECDGYFLDAVEQRRIAEVVSKLGPKKSRRKIHQTIKLGQKKAASVGKAGPAVEMQVVHCANQGDYDLIKPAAFDIVVVVRDDDMIKDLQIWDPKSGYNKLKQLSQAEKQTPAWLAKPGGHVFYLTDKSPLAWEPWAKAKLACAGRRIGCYNSGSSESTDFWRDLISAVLHVDGVTPDSRTPLNRPSLLSSTSVGKAPTAAASSSSSTTSAAAGKLPSCFSAVPSVQILFRGGNRSNRLTCVVLEGVVTLDSMRFAAFAIPSRGAIFTLQAALEVSDLDDYEDTNPELVTYKPGDVFVCGLGGASGTQRVRATCSGTVLRALPWPEQGAEVQAKIWKGAYFDVIRDRIGAAGQQQQQTLPPLSQAPLFIFSRPSSVLHLAWMRLRPVLPHETAVKEWRAHIGAAATTATKTNHITVHLATGMSDCHHQDGVPSPEAPQEEFESCSYSDNSEPPHCAYFFGGSVSRIAAEGGGGGGGKARLVHSETGAPFYCFVHHVATGGGAKLPVLAEIVDFVSFEDTFPAAFFDDRWGQQHEKRLPLPQQSVAGLPRLAEPAALFQQKTETLPWLPADAAMAERNRRAAAILAANPLLRKDLLEDNSNEEQTLFLLLGRNLFPASTGAERVAFWAASTDKDVAKAYIDSHVQQASNSGSSSSDSDDVVMPSLLEWSLGAWLPPFPRHLKKKAGGTSNFVRSKINPHVLGLISQALSSSGMQQPTNNSNDEPPPIARLLQITFQAVCECDFDTQMTGGAVPAGGGMQPLALCQKAMWCFIPGRFIPRNICSDISSTSRLTVNFLLSVATLAAKAGNIDLVAGICTRIAAGCCYQSCDDAFSKSKGIASLPLFPVNHQDFAPSQPVYWPAVSEDILQARQAASDKMSRQHKFDENLDQIIVALAGSTAAQRSDAFPSLLTHVAFSMIRILTQTLKSRPGAQFLIARKARKSPFSNIELQAAAAIAACAAKRSAEPNSAVYAENSRLLRCVGKGAASVFMVGSHFDSLRASMPASCGVLMWFLHSVLGAAVRRRIAANPKSICDPSAVTCRVAEFCFDMALKEELK